MSDDKVVQLPGTQPLPDNPLSIVDSSPNTSARMCSHLGGAELDVHTRTVTCTECGRVVDAFDYLLRQATVIQRAWTLHKQVTARVHEVSARVAALDKEEKRLKGRIQRAREKAQPSTTVRIDPRKPEGQP